MVRRRRSRGRGSESGQALVLALAALLLLGAALALVAGILVSRLQRAQRQADETELLALTDAAVAETLANLAAWPASAGVGPRSFGGGTIRSTVTRGGGGSFTVVAEATVRRSRLAVEVRGRLTDDGPVVDAWRRLAPGPVEGGTYAPGRRLETKRGATSRAKRR